MKVEDVLGNTFDKFIESIKKTIEEDKARLPMAILLRDSDTEKALDVQRLPIPSFMFGGNPEIMLRFIGRIADVTKSDGALFFITASMGIIKPPKKGNVEQFLSELELKGVDESDVARDVEVLMCLAETREKQIVKIYEIVSRDPYEWKDFVAGKKNVMGVFGGMMYKKGENKAKLN